MDSGRKWAVCYSQRQFTPRKPQWVKGGGLKFFLQLGSTGTFLSNFKVPRASFHFPHPIFLKFGTSRAQKLPKNSPNWPKLAKMAV